MAKFTPLIGSITGKIGGMVIGSNRTVRMFVKAANRTPTAFKTIFAQLAGAWPLSEVEAKTLVMKSPGVANGVKIVTRSSGMLYKLMPATPGSPGDNNVQNCVKYGPMPDRMVNLPGEFGELVQRGLLAYSPSMGDVAVTLRTPLATIDAAYFENPRVATVVLNLADVLSGTQMPTRGIRLYDLQPVGENWEFALDGLTANTEYLVAFSTFATIISSGQPIVLGHTAGYFYTAPPAD